MRKPIPWLTAIAALTTLGVVEIGWYKSTQPVLRHYDTATMLNYVRQLGAGRTFLPRQAAAAIHELELEAPPLVDPGMRLQLAYAIAGQRHGDLAQAEGDIDAGVIAALAGHTTGKVTRKELARSGLGEGLYEGWLNWASSFQQADVDGDGRLDVILAAPGGNESGDVCTLYRNTPAGWIPCRLSVGAKVMGIWVFDVTPGGPRAVMLESMEGGTYEPDTFFDVFVWRGGRMESVLAAAIHNGFEWQHHGAELRFFEQQGGRGAGEMRAAYTWDGTGYRQTAGERPKPFDAPDASANGSSRGDPEDALNTAEAALFRDRRYDRSLGELRAVEQVIRESGLDDPSQSELLRELYYHEAICLRHLGDRRAAALLLAGLARQIPNGWSELAERQIDFRSMPGERK